MSEMAQTADRVIVIGRGRLLADAPIGELLAGAAATVRVRTSDPTQLADLLTSIGATVDRRAPDGALQVTGTTAADVGQLARDRGLGLAELATEHTTLEQRYLELTGQSVDFHAHPEPGSTSRSEPSS